MPQLRRLSDADPAALTAALAAVRDAGDAAVVLPDDPPAGTVPAAVVDALRGRRGVPEGTALVVPTSGTTGTPRAVVLPWSAVDAAVAAAIARLDGRAGERWALALPVRHVAGLMVLLRARALGTDPVIVTDPGDPAALAAASASAAHVAVVPTQLARAIAAGIDLTAFRTVLVGGGPAPVGLIDRARADGVRVVTSYGMTETCGGCVYDGIPLRGTEVTTTATGRIRLRGPAVATALLDGTPLTDPDGWFTTSDLGRLEDGRLDVLGRADDVIVSGGVNVDPVAVADALRTHPAIADAVVVGVPNADLGVVARAVVVGAGGTDAIGLTGLRAHVTADLGAMNAPRELLIVDRIPRDGLGKVSAADRADLGRRPPTEVYSPA